MVNSMPDECCVNCWSNYGNGPKETVFFFHNEKKDYDLRQRWIRFLNREGWKPSKNSCICRKHFESHYYKTGTRGKRCRLIQKLKPVPTIFDSKESHLSAESKYLNLPVFVPKFVPKEFVNKISLSYLKNRAKSKVLILILLQHLWDIYFRNMTIV